ncbi:MAG: hypothetical protein K8F30_08600, partial [Taibaiella sp.]|nr:hypothetical protein [Taibaiella sp.]
MKPIFLLAIAVATCSNVTYAQEHRAKYQTIWGKDKTHLNLSIPFVNYIYSVPPGEPAYELTGLFGFSIGAGFCKTENRFQSFRV